MFFYKCYQILKLFPDSYNAKYNLPLSLLYKSMGPKQKTDIMPVFALKTLGELPGALKNYKPLISYKQINPHTAFI